MGRPKKDPSKEATDLRVLRAAEEAFGRLGYRDTRLEDIAEEAGIRRSSLLYHFGSKDALHQKVVDRAFDEFSEAFASALTLDGDYTTRLRAVISKLKERADERKGAVAVILREVVTPDATRSSHILERLSPLLDGIEAFVRAEGGSTKPKNYPFRSAILHLVLFHLVRAASSEGAMELLGNEEDTLPLAFTLLS